MMSLRAAISPFVPVLSVAAVVALIGVFGISLPKDAGAMADAMVAECADSSNRAECYEQKVPALYPQYSISAVFDIVREVRTLDPSYQFCHVLAHKIGERVVAEDPARWVDAIPDNPSDGLCSNGYIHGVVGGRFRAEVLSSSSIAALVPDFARACEPRANWAPSDLDRAICYHGMGHLYDFITDADIPQALVLCSQTTPEDYERVCVEGVFMQLYQPLEPDDFELIERMAVKPTKENVRSYCAAWKDPEYIGACLRESWPFFKDDIASGTVTDFCSGQPDKERTEYCYQTVSALAGRLSLQDLHKTDAACRNFPPERQLLCYGQSAQAVLEEDRDDAAKAVSLCAMAPERLIEGCMRYLEGHAQFLFGGNMSQWQNFCGVLPASLAAQCKEHILQV